MTPFFIRSPSDFQSVVTFGVTPETVVLEFKATVDDWDPAAGTPQKVKQRAQKEVCRDVAQFANTLGGCMLIGVSERLDPSTGLKIADSVDSLAKPDQLTQWIEQALATYLVPSTFSHEMTALCLQQGIVLAVNVPPSRHLISLWDRQDHTIEYLRRTSYGKEWMNPDEAERHLMDGARAGKLAFLAARAAAGSDRVEVAGGFWLRHANASGPDQRFNPTGPVKIGRIEEYSFELIVPRGGLDTVVVPFGVIREAWAAHGMIGLLLDVRLVVHANGATTIEA